MLDLRLAIEPTTFGDSPIKIHCLNPAHNDVNASMAVYSEHLHCFGCGFHRNDWDEALSLLLGITVIEAREVADKYELRNTGRPIERNVCQKLPPLAIGRAKLYHRFMRDYYPNKARWFHERGLEDSTINKEQLGYDGFRYTIPVYDGAGSLITIRYRADYTRLPDKLMDGVREVPVPKYSGITGRNGLYLYGAHWLKPERNYTIVCEGELDALLLHQLGYASCSATNGARQVRRIPGMLSELSSLAPGHCLYVATDADRGDGKQTRKGEEAAVEIALAATELGMVVYRLSWLIGKDVTEHYTAVGKIDFMKGRWNGKRFVY